MLLPGYPPMTRILGEATRPSSRSQSTMFPKVRLLEETKGEKEKKTIE
jgi:hypothetical protein